MRPRNTSTTAAAAAARATEDTMVMHTLNRNLNVEQEYDIHFRILINFEYSHHDPEKVMMVVRLYAYAPIKGYTVSSRKE